MRLALTILALGLATAAPAAAKTLSFSGTFVNSNAPAAPGGRCTGLTVNISNNAPFESVGTSNLGAFTSVQSHCLDGPPPIAIGAPDRPYYDGLFTYSFAGGATLFGTYTGLLTNAGTMGVIDNVQNFIVTGGSGSLRGATGAFTGVGDIRFASGPPVGTLTITNGTITTAVPEPAAWTMMILGFGLVGGLTRGRSKQRRIVYARAS